MSEVPRRPPHFPHALVRFVPDVDKMFEQDFLELPGVRSRSENVLTCGIKRIQNFAEDLELQLLSGAVADANGATVAEPSKPRNLVLRQPALPDDAIHDPKLIGLPGDGA